MTRAQRLWWGAILLGPLLVACDQTAVGTDAGTDAAQAIAAPNIPWLDDGVPAIAPPAPVTMPQLTPCPSGWREVPPDTADDVATCDPYPASGPADCPRGSAHFPGEPGCTTVGAACPAGEWPEGLPPTDVVYVRAGEPAGGDGTSASPFATVVEGLAAVAGGGTIAIARGTYDLALEVTQPVTLRGACAAETLLTTSDASARAVVQAQASDVILRDLRVGEAPVTGLWLERPEWSLSVEGVIVERATGAGILIAASTFSGRSVVVRETAASSDGTLGRGVRIRSGATAELARALVEQNRDIGIEADGRDTMLRLEDTVVRDTQGRQSDSTEGRGLEASAGASVEVTRGLFERNRDIGVATFGGSTVRLEDVIVRDTRSQASDLRFGRGLGVETGGSVEVVRGLFERNRVEGVFASGSSVTVQLEDTVIRETLSEESSELYGSGLNVARGASVSLTRGLIEDSLDTGIFMSGAGTSVRLEDTVVRDTLGQESDGAFGRGLSAQEGASVEAARVLFERNRNNGVWAIEEGTTLRLEDIVVRETQSQESSGDRGHGLYAALGASVEVVRGTFERNREAGIICDGAGTMVRLTDVVVRDTQSRESDGAFGRGLVAQFEASVNAVRALFEGNRENGVFAHGAGATIRLEDAVVRDSLSQVSDLRSGNGIGAGAGASVVLVRGLLERNRASSAIAGGEGSMLRLEDVVVRDTRSEEADGGFGRGLEAQAGADVEVVRAVFEHNRELGVIAIGAGAQATVRLEDTRIVDTVAAECGASCPNGAGGMGAGAYGNATLTLERFAIVGAVLCGVQVAETGVIELHDGEVSETEIGACVQVPGYPLALLNDRVVYRDNVANIEATSFPTPSPGSAPEL